MSKALNSPTARILRSSRFFSLPPPLPLPSIDLSAGPGQIKTSDSATLPYPSLQAITSPASSRNRGDWGLKRPLPPRTSARLNPHVRVNAIDTMEHITDYSLAVDHTLSLRKWQEMNIWMTQDAKEQEDNPLVSAFQEDRDNTVVHDGLVGSIERGEGDVSTDSLPLGSERALRMREYRRSITSDNGPTRWKLRGPWLPGMTELEFEKYLQRVVAKPNIQEEFRVFLLSVRIAKRRAEALSQMQAENGFNPDSPEDMARLEEMSKIEDPRKEVDTFMLELRDNYDGPGSELSSLLQDFFDLPRLPGIRTGASELIVSTAHKSKKNDFDAPPELHPSAGLSYLRNNAFIENHMAYGPQVHPSAVRGRVLQPRLSSVKTRSHALLGVGGFVAEDPASDKRHKLPESEFDAQRGLMWDFETPGGTKVWVHPKHASVDETGRVHMAVCYADHEAVAVRTLGADPRKVLPEDTENEIRAKFKGMWSDPDSPEGQHHSSTTTSSDRLGNNETPVVASRRAGRAMPLDGDELRSFKDAVKQAADGRTDPQRRLGMDMLSVLGGGR